MNKEALLIALAIAGVFLLARRAFASTTEGGYLLEDGDVQPASSDPDYWFLGDANQVENINMGSPEQNLLAFLAMIRKFETNDNYNIVYGGQSFNDFSRHPAIRVPINIPGYEGKYSTAAGAYQFLLGTWNALAERLQLTDFTPASQDAAAVALLSEIGAMPAIQRGDFDEALRLASTKWASLPYSAAKQNPKSLAAANEFLTRYLDSMA